MSVVSSKFSFGLLIILFLLALLPVAIADSSFSSGPSVDPATNITTSTSLRCSFTALGAGTITANVSWYNGSTLTSNDCSQTVANNTPANICNLPTSQTRKGESWRCEATIDDTITVTSTNSSAVVIQNSNPVVISPVGVVSVTEDTPYSTTATAYDADNDLIDRWMAIDLNDSFYGSSLFSMSGSSGLISFTAQNDSVAGNHSMYLSALTGIQGGILTVIFQVTAVNDAPILTSLSKADCVEDSVCAFQLTYTDEENDNVTFTTNDSSISLNSTGYFNFTPDFNDVGSTLVEINLSDSRGANSTAIFNLTVSMINHDPFLTFNGSSPATISQNSPLQISYTINASDNDSLDTINFTFTPNCNLDNPWNSTKLANGSSSTNASFVIFKNISIMDNNSFVACRNITVTFFDVYAGSAKQFINYTIIINVTNENDPPFINQYANYSQNQGYSDMHNVSTPTGDYFSYLVNASDIDSLTYEGESINFSIYGGNSSLFTINSSTGLINSSVPLNTSHIGNLSFFINVTDDEGFYYIEYINITVINNSAPTFNLFNDSSCAEDTNCTKEISAYDVDFNLYNHSSFYLEIFRPQLNASGDIVFNDSSKEVYSTDGEIIGTYINYVSYTNNVINYSFNFTPNNTAVGLYHLNVTFMDDFKIKTQREFYFNVTNVNDPPIFDEDADHSLIQNITFPNFVENVSFTDTFYVYDPDLLYGLDNLTVNYSLTSSNISYSDFTLTKLNESTFKLDFEPNSSHLGPHQINLTVTDLNGSNFTQSINFTVQPPGSSPSIDGVKPWMSGNTLMNTFQSNLGSVGLVQANENDTLTFDINVTDPDGNEDDLVVRWYVDNILNNTVNYSSAECFVNENCAPTNVHFNFFDEGSHRVDVEVEDLNFNVDTFYWDIVINNTNRNPTFVNDLVDLSIDLNRSIEGPTQYYDFFGLFDYSKMVFFDPDDDTNSNGILDLSESSDLTFVINESSDCLSLSLASFDFTGKDLVISPTKIGTCYANFTATDEFNATVTSNNIRIDITDTQSDYAQQSSGSSNTRVETRTISVPYAEEVDSPKPFKLIYPGIAVIYANGSIVIPIQLKNTWSSSLRNVQLFANSSYVFQEFYFTNDFFVEIPKEEVININLTMSNYRADGPFEVNVSAYVDSEDYTETETILVNALERGHEDSKSLKSRIGFARDLLSDNPECEELNELLNEADAQADSNPQGGIEVLNAVINSCKYLVNEAKSTESNVPKSFLGKLNIFDGSKVDFSSLILVVAVLFIGALIVGVISSIKLKKI